MFERRFCIYSIHLLFAYFNLDYVKTALFIESFDQTRKINGHIIWQQHVPSISVCCALCGIDQLCKTVSFEKTKNICTGHSRCPAHGHYSTPTCSCPGCNVMWKQNAECNPIVTTTFLPTLNQDQCIGNPHGNTPFIDESLSIGKNITRIKIDCERGQIRSIQVQYGSTMGPKHPDNGYEFHGRYNLDNDEYVTNDTVKVEGIVIRHLLISTNKRVFPECAASNKGEPITVSGRRLLYISGRYGEDLDCVAFHWA